MSAFRDRELSEIASAERRRRILPPAASCEVCATTDHLSRRADRRIRCYAHLRSESDAVEQDHWAGVGILPQAVIPLHANAHRRVTEIRRLVGFDDLPHPSGDPSLLLARLLVGIGCLLILLGRWLADDAAARPAGAPPPPFPVMP